MKGGKVYGVGAKGIVFDYGATFDPLNSKNDQSFENIEEEFAKNKQTVTRIDLHLLTERNEVELQTNTDAQTAQRVLKAIKTLDTEKEYVVKEFKVPKVYGATNETNMNGEIEGFKKIATIVRNHEIVGIPYEANTLLIAVQIFLGKTSRCFVVNKKCQQTMKEQYVNNFTEEEFQQFVIDILSTLVELQGIEIAHGDIKLDNIMKCDDKYQLIDWEYNRPLKLDELRGKSFLGMSPMYFKIKYGRVWYSAFSVALLNYYKETGGYDTRLTSRYATNMMQYYSELFKTMSLEAVFEKVKLSLDLCAFGMVLYGILLRNGNINKTKYSHFIMDLYKEPNATVALQKFLNLKDRKVREMTPCEELEAKIGKRFVQPAKVSGGIRSRRKKNSKKRKRKLTHRK
jgi:serine/threonine protein kinase